MDTLGISIIIPAFNRANTLPLCLDSLLGQTYTNFEIIVVDDHSTDDTRNVVSEYSEKDSRVKYVLQAEGLKGAQSARKTGVLKSSFEWLMFHDSDDTWEPNKIEIQLTYLENEGYKTNCVFYSDCYLYDVNSKEKTEWKLPSVSNYVDLLDHPAPTFPTLFCSKELLLKAGNIDPNVPAYQEWDTSLLLAKHGGKFIHIKEPLFTYYVGGNDTISKSKVREIAGRYYIYKKYESDIKKNLGEPNFRQKYFDLFDYFKNNISEIENWNQNELLCEFLNVFFYKYGSDIKDVNTLSIRQLMKLLIKKTIVWKLFRKFLDVKNYVD